MRIHDFKLRVFLIVMDVSTAALFFLILENCEHNYSPYFSPMGIQLVTNYLTLNREVKYAAIF